MNKPTKTTTKHPYAAIEHRVIDSPAYADLSHSACRLLTLLTRQLTKDNNGNLQATFGWCKERGIGSEHTLRDAIADLITHGFIYRTRSHGANRAWAKYAVTWLSVSKRDGLFLDGFVSCAWRSWEPVDKKSYRQKVQEQSGRKCSFKPDIPAESAGTRPAESAEYEYVPCISTKQAVVSNELTDEPDTGIFTRSKDSEQISDNWDELGEYHAPQAKARMRSPELDRVRGGKLEAMRR